MLQPHDKLLVESSISSTFRRNFNLIIEIEDIASSCGIYNVYDVNYLDNTIQALYTTVALPTEQEGVLVSSTDSTHLTTLICSMAASIPELA